MKLTKWAVIGLAALAIFAVPGCGGDEAVSKEEEAKLKADLTKGGNKDAMTDEQKKQFEEYMKGRNTAPSAPGTQGN